MEQLILSLLSVGIFALTLFVLGTVSAKTQPALHVERPFSNTKMDGAMVLSVLFFALICGVRYRYGADCESYAAGMENIARGTGRDMEILYVWLTKALYFAGLGRVVYMGTLAAIQGFLMWSAFKTRRFLLPYVGLVLILGPFFGEWNNGIRQIIAGLFFFYAMIRLIDEKKILPYVVLIIAASLFHKSAIVLLAFIPLMKYDYIPNRYLALGLLAFCLFVGESSLLDQALWYGEQMLAQLGYHNYSGDYEQLMGRGSSISHFGPRQLTLLATHIMIIWFSPAVYAFNKRDKAFSVCYLMTLVYACSSQLLMSKSYLFSRPLLYLLPFVLMSTAYLLDYLKRGEKQKIFFYIALVVTCSFTVLAAVANAGAMSETAIYKFISLQ